MPYTRMTRQTLDLTTIKHLVRLGLLAKGSRDPVSRKRHYSKAAIKRALRKRKAMLPHEGPSDSAHMTLSSTNSPMFTNSSNLATEAQRLGNDALQLRLMDQQAPPFMAQPPPFRIEDVPTEDFLRKALSATDLYAQRQREYAMFKNMGNPTPSSVESSYAPPRTPGTAIAFGRGETPVTDPKTPTPQPSRASTITSGGSSPRTSLSFPAESPSPRVGKRSEDKRS